MLNTSFPKGLIISIFASFLFLFPFTLEASISTPKLLINHIGYETSSYKQAILLGKKANQPGLCKITDKKTGKIMMEVSPVKVGVVDKWRDWFFWTINFSGLKTEGEYYIECKVDDHTIQSSPFLIESDLLEKHTLSNVVNYFKTQRSSGLRDKADRNLPFLDNPKKKRIDLHGGWFDATGDYGKHLSHLSFASYFNPQQIPMVVFSLFKVYEELNRGNNPNFAQYKRRVLDEALHGADYLVRVKADSGSFYRSVSAPGPKKLPEDRIIVPAMTQFSITKSKLDGIDDDENAKDISKNHSYEASFRAGGGIAIAALAIASRYKVNGDFDHETYLKTAEDAFEFLKENNPSLTNDGKENIIDDYTALVASTELYLATRNSKYRSNANNRANNLLGRLSKDKNYSNYWRVNDTNRPFFHAAEAGFPVVSLLGYYSIAPEKQKKEILDVIKKSMGFELEITNEVKNPFGYARQYTENKKGEREPRFFYPHDTETAPWWQGENARLSSLAVAARMAANIINDDDLMREKLRAYAWNQVNWILGLNPFDACMLNGSGRNNVQYKFFNSYEYTNAPGGIVNGITSGLYNEHDIDLNRGYAETGKDNDWRWAEQWLPHAAWYIWAISLDR